MYEDEEDGWYDEKYNDCEMDLVDQFEHGGDGDSIYDFDPPLTNQNFGMALSLAEEIALDVAEEAELRLEEEMRASNNRATDHEVAISITANQKNEDPFFKFVRETCAGTRNLDEFFTKAERREQMRKEYV